MADEKILVDVLRIREQISEWYDHGSGLERSILKDVLDLIDKEAADGITIWGGDEYVASLKQVTMPRALNMEWFISRWEDLRKMQKEKRLINVHDCPCDGCKAKPCGHPARCLKFAEWLNKTVDAVEVTRLGKLGKLMMPYKGCPRGAIGPRGYTGTETPIMELDPIEDVDGNRWVPVLEDDLKFLKTKLDGGKDNATG